MDTLTREQRAKCMSRVRGKDTKPEMVVRRIIHGMGFRYALHSKALPGKPDIVLTRHRKVVFVHGCFWHGHSGCKRSARPTTNAEFWDRKLDRNLARDRQHIRSLESDGWSVLVVWECRTRDVDALQRRIGSFLAS